MKTKITVLIAAVALVATSFKLASDNSLATVQEVEGMKVFLYCKPSAKFDVSGSVKAPFIEKDAIDGRIKVLVGRAKKEYPSAEGLIINNTLQNAEVIRFKE